MCSFRPKDTPGLRAPGSKWARLLDNLPGVPLNVIDAPDVSAGQNLWDKNQLWPQWVQSSNRVRPKMEKTLELDQDTNDENVPVSSTDELSSGGGLAADRTRKLGEFSRTNSPLSAEEIKKRRTRGWADIVIREKGVQKALPLFKNNGSIFLA